MDEDVDRSRRSLLWVGPVAGFALAVPAALFGQKKKEHEAEEVTPAEDRCVNKCPQRKLLSTTTSPFQSPRVISKCGLSTDQLKS